MGEYTLGEVDGQTLKMSNAFAGGIGSSHTDLCGAFTAGVMLIGALHGRTRPDADDDYSLQLANAYRARFGHELGSVNCGELRRERFGPQGEPCSALVEKAVMVFFETLDAAADKA